MGLYDRDYTRDGYDSRFRNAPQMRMTFPKLTPAVKWLLIINVAVFFVAIIIKPLGVFIYEWFQIDATSPARALQLWRLIGYQFLHDPGSFAHIFFNMLGLFFLGPTLERHWGSRKFTKFYLSCGVAGALLYLFLVVTGVLSPGVMVGASGAILGLLAACAILFPHFVVFILFFPVPIRIAAIAGTLFFIFAIATKGANAGGEAAHLGGMIAGAIYVFSQGWRSRTKSKLRQGQWEKKVNTQQQLEIELDRILKKVHNNGIASLTSKEKKILKQATLQQQIKNNTR